MLLQPPLKGWCCCLAPLGPLALKEGGLGWGGALCHLSWFIVALEVKKCEIMKGCLGVYWRA